jgi:hypothetical protein
MRERTDQIESQIQEERGELRANLDELGSRVRSATDWRRQFRHNPMLGLGLAFGGGLLLAGLLRGGTARNARQYAASTPPTGRGPLRGAWETIQSALVGVAANKASDVLSELVPGFREHLAKASHAFRFRRSDNGHGVQGEGDYEAGRRYRASAESYVRTADVAAAARAAEPRTESEAEELQLAEQAGRHRARRN